MVAKRVSTANQQMAGKDNAQDDPHQLELVQQLEQLSQECQQKEEAYKRALADYQNLRRQTDQERIRLIQMAGADVITTVLPVYDHLEMALSHSADPAIKMITEEFWQALAQHGLEKMKIESGQEFDHHFMEVVETQAGKENCVLQVTQAGYRLNGQVIRHAKVIVGKKSKE